MESVKQLFFTQEEETKKSSHITLPPRTSFHLLKNMQSDIFVIEGGITVNSSALETGAFVSTKGAIIENPTNEMAETFLYEEPYNEKHKEILLQPYEYQWYFNNVPGLKQAKLRDWGHIVSLVQWETGTEIPFHIHDFGEEIYVLKGELFDRGTSIKKGEWKRMLPKDGHAPHTQEQTLILLRNGHLLG